MTFKVNSLNPFDKGFFGKTLNSWSKRNVAESLTPSNLKLDSFDDFNKHFDIFTFTKTELQNQANQTLKSTDLFEHMEENRLITGNHCINGIYY